LILKGITNQGSKKLEREVKRLHDEVVTLKTAIKEAINKGQKSLGDLNGIPRSGWVSNKNFALICVNSSLVVVDQVVDF
jgi:hypothetical protein